MCRLGSLPDSRSMSPHAATATVERVSVCEWRPCSAGRCNSMGIGERNAWEVLTCRNGSEPASLQAPGRATVQPQKAQGKGFFTILRNSATEKAAGSPTAARRTDLAPQNSTLGGPRGFAGTPPRPRFFVASRDTVLLRQALTVRRDIRPPCAGLKPLPTCTPRLLPRGSPLAEPSAPGAVGLTPSVLHSAALGTPAIGFVELVDVVEGPCRTRLRPNDATRSYGQKAIMSSSTSTLQPCKPFLALESLEEQDPSFPKQPRRKFPGRRLLGELRTSEGCEIAFDNQNAANPHG